MLLHNYCIKDKIQNQIAKIVENSSGKRCYQNSLEYSLNSYLRNCITCNTSIKKNKTFGVPTVAEWKQILLVSSKKWWGGVKTHSLTSL